MATPSCARTYTHTDPLEEPSQEMKPSQGSTVGPTAVRAPQGASVCVHEVNPEKTISIPEALWKEPGVSVQPLENALAKYLDVVCVVGSLFWSFVLHAVLGTIQDGI